MTINREHLRGPFDIIGDVHGCFAELLELLNQLGYSVIEIDAVHKRFEITAPNSRMVIFLGDLVDRGPDAPSVLGLAMSMVEKNLALCVPGNHDVKFVKRLKGRPVSLTHGLAETMQQIESYPAEFKNRVIEFFDEQPFHMILDDGRLIVAHAGIKESLQGKDNPRVKAFALYGDTNGDTDEYGLPIRRDWGANYSGAARVVHGHTPVLQPRRINNTVCVDTGCVFGGMLTAYRYPEDELVSVQAKQMYCQYAKPLA